MPASASISPARTANSSRTKTRLRDDNYPMSSLPAPCTRHRSTLLALLSICGLIAHGAAAAGPVGLPVTPPVDSDQIALSWLNGAPILNAFRPEDKALATYRPENSALLIRGAHYGMVIDRSQPGLITRLNTKPDAGFATADISAATIEKQWSPSALHLIVKWRGKEYRGAPDPVVLKGFDWTELPVRMIETGIWFQHVQIAGISLVDDGGNKLPTKTSLDVRAWGDRAVIEWSIVPESPLDGAEASLAFDAAGKTVDSQAQTGLLGPVSLRLAFQFTPNGVKPGLPREAGLAITSSAPGTDQPKVSFSKDSGGWEVVLPKLQWPNPENTAYPEALLDRVSKYGLTIENSSAEEMVVPLRMVHPSHPLTGVVPMLVDAEGRQTGLSVQVSKNWHTLPKKRLPYDGPWSHGSAFFRVPPRSTAQLGYHLVHARWQGVSMASVAQLCLVGWGGHGNWNEFALGSWGESFCVQPERMQRRALITDVRPFLVLGMNGRKWSWPTNVGGGDVMNIITADGQYLPWRTIRTGSRLIGPNLAHLGIDEVSRDGRLALRTDIFLPRSDDLMRTYLRVRLDVLEDVAIDRVSFFQLGADYYNENQSDTVAFGEGAELVAEHTPAAKPWQVVVPPMPVKGAHPWVTLYGKLPAPDSGHGYGTRGLIFHGYRAHLGGDTSDTPYFAGYSSFNHKIPKLGAEVVAPPELKKLRKGDWVEFTIEFVVFPANNTSFYGKDPALIQALTQGADTWRMTAWEAAANQPRLLLADGTKIVTPPLSTTLADLKNREFRLEGGSGLVPVQISGLPAFDGWRFEEQTDGQWQEIGRRFPEETQPQVSFDPVKRSWDVILSLRTRGVDGNPITRNLRITGIAENLKTNATR